MRRSFSFCLPGFAGGARDGCLCDRPNPDPRPRLHPKRHQPRPEAHSRMMQVRMCSARVGDRHLRRSGRCCAASRPSASEGAPPLGAGTRLSEGRRPTPETENLNRPLAQPPPDHIGHVSRESVSEGNPLGNQSCLLCLVFEQFTARNGGIVGAPAALQLEHIIVATTVGYHTSLCT
jgi:hypothetical protein